MMTRLRLFLLSTIAGCATLTSALALAQLQDVVVSKVAVPQDVPKSTTVKFKPTRVGKVEGAPPSATPAPSEKSSVLIDTPAPADRKTLPGKAAVKDVMVKRIVPNQMNLDGQVQQMMMQVRPILRAEFHIIRVACRPTAEQRKAIAQGAEQALWDATRKYVEAMRRPMTPAQRTANDPRKMIQEGLVQVLKSHLSEEQVALYRKEIAIRAEAKKQLALRNLVARLDHDLILSPEQRAKLGESLAAHWDDAWGQSLEMYLYDNNFFPPITDQYVSPFLNESQKRIWKGAQKVQAFWGGMGIVGGIMADDPLEDEELRDARLAAAKKNGTPARPALPKMEMMKAEMKFIEKGQSK